MSEQKTDAIISLPISELQKMLDFVAKNYTFIQAKPLIDEFQRYVTTYGPKSNVASIKEEAGEEHA